MTRRGLGKIELSIATAFIQHPERSHTVAELAVIAYPDVRTIGKRHRVATIRAADRVAEAIGWTALPLATKPRQIAFVSLTHPASLAHFDIRTGSATGIRSGRRLEDLEAMWRRRVMALADTTKAAVD